MNINQKSTFDFITFCSFYIVQLSKTTSTINSINWTTNVDCSKEQRRADQFHAIKCINFNPIKIFIFDIDSDKLCRNTKATLQGTKTDMLNYNYICIEMRLNFKCNLRECIIMVSWWKKKTNQPIMLLDKIIIWIRAICSCVLCVFRKFLFHIDLGQKADPVQEDASDHEEHCIVDFTSYLNTYALCGVLFVLILIIAFSWKNGSFS